MYQTLMQVGGAAPQAPWWQTPALMVGVFAIIYFFMLWISPRFSESFHIAYSR